MVAMEITTILAPMAQKAQLVILVLLVPPGLLAIAALQG